MNTLKSLLLGLGVAGGGVLFAMNAPQQESICSDRDHDGYTYSGSGTPPLPFDPNAEELPAGVIYEGRFDEEGGFTCTENNTETCHWVYMPVDANNPTAKWVECKGDYVDLP